MKPGGVVLHCSASPYGSVEMIDRWHADRGFKRNDPRGGLLHIGYHYVIGNGRLRSSNEYAPEFDGAIWRGRREGERGAHAIGVNSWIGVCMIGRDGVFSPAQYAALWGLCGAIVVRYAFTDGEVIGHCETAHELAARHPKTCPELDMLETRSAIFAVAVAIKDQMMSGGVR